MQVVYSKGYLPNGCPTCDSPSFSDELVFEDVSLKDLLYKIWNECYEYVYSNIYSKEGAVIVKVYPEYSRHCVTHMKFKTIAGDFHTEDDGSGKTIIVKDLDNDRL